MPYAFARYGTRVVATWGDVTADSGDELLVWTFPFSSGSTLSIDWPPGTSGATPPTTGLGLMGIPGLRPRGG